MLGLAFLAVLAAFPGGGPHPVAPDAPNPSATQTFTLYGSTAGWGTTAGTITSPGPTLTVSQGDQVTISLNAASGTHDFLIDYNGNTGVDPGEPHSALFSPSVPRSLTFTANPAGTFTYWCTIHFDNMRGTFIVVSSETPPTAALSAPDGAQDWTGGTVHRIWWNLSDAQDPNTNLVVFLNYSSSAGSDMIAGPLSGTANPNAYDWTVPRINATDARVNLTVLDTTGRKGYDEKPVASIDSAPPQVTLRLPAPGASGVQRLTNVEVTWSEGMDTAATGGPATFGLRNETSGAWIPGDFRWSSPQNTILTFDPLNLLDPGATYRVVVNDTARDASDPGNLLAVPVTWTFTTGATVDSKPPTISSASAIPASQQPGGRVNVSATVTDNAGVATVSLDVLSPSGSTNASMAPAPGNVFYLDRAYAQVGVYSFTVWASDTSGLWSSRAGGFEIRDQTPPTVQHSGPSALLLGEPYTVTATVTDNDAISVVRLNWTDAKGSNANVSMAASGATYSYSLPQQLWRGTMSYFIVAIDLQGNVAKTAPRTIAVEPPAGTVVLFGATPGWGHGPDNLTSPGPAITIRLGSTVEFLIIGFEAGSSPYLHASAVGTAHSFFVDWDGNGVPSSGETVSTDVRDNSTRISVYADRAGTFSYYCAYHSGAMRGQITVVDAGAGPGPDSTVLFLLGGVGVVVVVGVAALLLERRRRSP